MANKGRIDEIIDIQAVEQQISTTNKMLDLTIGRLEKAAQSAAILNETFKNAKGIKAISDAQAILNEEYIKAQKEAENLRKAEEKKRKEIEKALAIQEKAAQKERDLIDAATKEAKTIDDLKAKVSALTKLRNRFNSETEAGRKAIEDYNKQIDESKKKLTELQSGDEKRISGIGKYKEGVLAAGKTLLGWAAAAGIAVGAAEIFKGIIGSTQGTADRFEANMTGIKEATNQFFRAVATGDFTNLIKGLRDAYTEGKRYAQTLDEIQDRQIALDIQKKSIELEIVQLKTIARDRSLDLKDRQAAVDKIAELQIKSFRRTKEENKINEDNELHHAAVISGLHEKTIKDLLTNYDKRSSAIKKGEEIEQSLIERSYETTYTKDGFMMRTKSLTKYKEELSKLSQTEQTYVRWAKGMNLLNDEQREKLKEVIGGVIDADRELADNQSQMNKIRNSLYSELIGNEKEFTQAKEKENKKQIDNLKSSVKSIQQTNDALIDSEMANILKLSELTDNQLKNEAANLQSKLKINQEFRNSYTELTKDMNEDIEEAEKTHQEKMKSIREAAFETVKSLSQGVADLVSIGYEKDLQNIDEQSKADEEAKQKELDRAGNNAHEKDRINKKYQDKEKQREQERKKIEHDKAVAQKQATIFSIILDTAKAIVSHLTTPWLIPFDVATGAIQLAVASAAPIPKYKKGRKGGPGEIAIVGEEGTEAIRLLSGKTYYTPDKETMTYLPAGADVIPNHELRKQLAYQAIESNRYDSFSDLKNEVRNLQKGFEYMADVYKNKQETHFHWDNGELRKAIKNGHNWTEYVNENYKI